VLDFNKVLGTNEVWLLLSSDASSWRSSSYEPSGVSLVQD
jgi:hypothetical protein